MTGGYVLYGGYLLDVTPAQLVGANFNGANAMGPDLPGYLFRAEDLFLIFLIFLLVDFFPRDGYRIYQTGGGRRSKHWPLGAGDPRDATDAKVYNSNQ